MGVGLNGWKKNPPVPLENTWVEGCGPVPSKLMIVGEAPADTEVEQGKPFVGKTGVEVSNFIERFLQMQRSQVYTTNMFKHP